MKNGENCMNTYKESNHTKLVKERSKETNLWERKRNKLKGTNDKGDHCFVFCFIFLSLAQYKHSIYLFLKGKK